MTAVGPSDVTPPADPALSSRLQDAIDAGLHTIQLCDAAGASLPACHFQFGVDILKELLEHHERGPRSPLR